MSEILKEICTYFIFLMLLLLVAYGNRDPNMYLLRKTLHESFVDQDPISMDLGDVCILCLCYQIQRVARWPNDLRAGLRIERSGFEPWPGHCFVALCVLKQHT